MKPLKLFLATILVSFLFGITNSCSQSSPITNPTPYAVFEASTPCDELSKSLLEIMPDTKCEFMKWKLTLFKDSKNSNPTDFNLICTYGMGKQASRDFQTGAKTIELKGKWSIHKGTKENVNIEVVTLKTESPKISLSFFQPGPNLLHLLDRNNQPMVGGPWSYTLNRVNPVSTKSEKFESRAVSMVQLETDSATVGVFLGRTPCNSALRDIQNITAEGCQIIKCKLTLFQDIRTHTPTTFHLYTIYVGKGDTKYSTTGKWTVKRGIYQDPSAIVYQLEPDSGKLQSSLLLLKLDKNILLFLDNNQNLLVGNNFASYTLNIAKE